MIEYVGSSKNLSENKLLIVNLGILLEIMSLYFFKCIFT